MLAKYTKFICLFLVIFLSACASTTKPTDPSDPYEGFNRAMYSFNTTIDKAVIKPVAKGYDYVAPQFVQTRVTNFFGNLNDVRALFNDILQADLYYSLSDFWRIVINSTAGVLGLFDVASHMELEKHANDFGLTLAKWGYKNSSYLVLPLLGPSTVRDTLGLPVDVYTQPYTYVKSDNTRYSLVALKVINTRARLFPTDRLIEDAFDPYVFVRNAYLQHRNASIKQEGHDPYIESNDEESSQTE